MVLTAYIVRAPVRPAFVSPSPRAFDPEVSTCHWGARPARLGRSLAHCTSDNAFASIASRAQRLVTIGRTPLLPRRDTHRYAQFLIFRKYIFTAHKPADRIGLNRFTKLALSRKLFCTSSNAHATRRRSNRANFARQANQHACKQRRPQDAHAVVRGQAAPTSLR
jgi:hypothetical protein